MSFEDQENHKHKTYQEILKWKASDRQTQILLEDILSQQVSKVKYYYQTFDHVYYWFSDLWPACWI